MISQFLIQYKAIILFYLAIIVFLVLKRKKLDIQAKFIILYRMKWGLRWMDSTARKFREWIVLLGYIGTGLGFVGMLFIIYILFKNLYMVIAQPSAMSSVSLVLPGVNVPGMGVLPFWYWLIAIFIIAMVHEFSHGVVANAHNIPVKNSGIVFFGPILGAFVEPDERKLQKQTDIAQYSVLAAGSFSNVLLALVALLLLFFATTPLLQTMVEPTGFTFDAYVEGDFPVAQAGIAPGTLITGVNSQPTPDFQKFNEELQFLKAGERVTIQAGAKEYALILGEHPDNPHRGFLGINGITNEVQVKEPYQEGIGNIGYSLLNWLNGLLRWLFLLSFGIGLFNLLPLPIVDGGRMAQVFLHKLRGPEEGEKRYRQISVLLLLVLVLNLIFPLLSGLF